MDLLYSEHCFRRYFKFFDKNKWIVPAETMEEKSFALKVDGLVNTLKLNANRTQVQCCMYELADMLDKAQPQQIGIIDDDIHEIILTNMNRHITDADIQRDGLFSIFQLMKYKEEIQKNLVTLRIHFCTVQRMTTYPTDITIQAIGCRIINRLITNNDIVKQEIVAMNAVDIIIKAMDHFDDDDDLQLWAMQALTQLLQSNSDLQEKFLQQKNCLLVLERTEKLQEYSKLAAISC